MASLTAHEQYLRAIGVDDPTTFATELLERSTSDVAKRFGGRPGVAFEVLRVSGRALRPSGLGEVGHDLGAVDRQQHRRRPDDLRAPAATADDDAMALHRPCSSIHSGRPGGRANGVTPPIVIPVSSAVASAGANDALRTPSRVRTTRLTSSRVEARTTQAAYTGGTSALRCRPTTTMAFAESSSS